MKARHSWKKMCQSCYYSDVSLFVQAKINLQQTWLFSSGKNSTIFTNVHFKSVNYTTQDATKTTTPSESEVKEVLLHLVAPELPQFTYTLHLAVSFKETFQC